jgi:hypothetical protein
MSFSLLQQVYNLRDLIKIIITDGFVLLILVALICLSTDIM